MSELKAVPQSWLNKVEKLLALMQKEHEEDWMSEARIADKFDLGPGTLRKLRNEHPECWRYLPSSKGCDAKDRTIRRNIQYNAVFIEGLYKYPNKQ